jgi:hypothetical protein
MGRVSELLARARAATSLEDFGETSFREGRLILCRDDPGYHNWMDTQGFERAT